VQMHRHASGIRRHSASAGGGTAGRRRRRQRQWAGANHGDSPVVSVTHCCNTARRWLCTVCCLPCVCSATTVDLALSSVPVYLTAAAASRGPSPLHGCRGATAVASPARRMQRCGAAVPGARGEFARQRVTRWSSAGMYYCICSLYAARRTCISALPRCRGRADLYCTSTCAIPHSASVQVSNSCEHIYQSTDHVGIHLAEGNPSQARCRSYSCSPAVCACGGVHHHLRREVE
jgi:hypothetical protein